MVAPVARADHRFARAGRGRGARDPRERSVWPRSPLALPAPAPAPVAVIAPHPAPAPSADAVYLDGEAVELGALGDDNDSALGALGGLDDEPSTDDDIIGNALLPTPDLAWVDDLDSESLAVAERWLVEQKGS